tara:strand:+ start:1730 stop:2185 length:456 start_codon:yes stop_codon:yes gene_type:complete
VYGRNFQGSGRMSWQDILKAVRYSGITLDNSRRELLDKVDIPEGWEVVAHHMTIVPFSPIVHPKGKHDFSEDYPVGSQQKLTVTHVGQSDKALAVKVEPAGPISPKVKFPHITVAVNREEGGKPFDSNKIPEENFVAIKPFELSGIVEEVS